MIYCDTSFLVSIITAETHSDVARRWYFPDARGACAISDWTITEMASAIAMKHRRKAIADALRHAAETAWSALRSEMAVLPVTPSHFARAAMLVDTAPRGLRAGDALHLAIAIDHRCDLATFDRDLADAARDQGIMVHPAAT